RTGSSEPERPASDTDSVLTPSLAETASTLTSSPACRNTTPNWASSIGLMSIANMPATGATEPGSPSRIVSPLDQPAMAPAAVTCTWLVAGVCFTQAASSGSFEAFQMRTYEQSSMKSTPA